MAWEWITGPQSLSSTIHPWLGSETQPPMSCSQPMTEHSTAHSRAGPFLGDTGPLWWLALAQGLAETYTSNGLRNFHLVFLHVHFYSRSDVHCGLSSPSFSKLHLHAFIHVPHICPPKQILPFVFNPVLASVSQRSWTNIAFYPFTILGLYTVFLSGHF